MPHVNLAAPSFDLDPEDPDGYHAGMFRPGPGWGAQITGASLYELPPGQSICPYHYEFAEEEWLLVLAGAPTLRTPDGEQVLAPLDLAFFPRGPAGAHKVTNGTQETVRVLMFSPVITPAATVYPDSDKVGIWTGNRDDDVLVRRSSRVGYYDGEPGVAT